MKFIKKILFIFVLLVLLTPIKSLALSSDYEDLIYKYVDVEPKPNVVNIYLFYGDSCPHCANEKKVLTLLENKYGDKIKIYKYETWENSKNRDIMVKIKNDLEGDSISASPNAVPYTIIGKKTFTGYSEYVGEQIENYIIKYLGEEEDKGSEHKTVVESSKVKIPFLGEVNTTDSIVGVAAVILGFVDGFNPCAMWVLLFVINMLFGMKDKRKMFILGFAFLFSSSAFYFVSMLGINLILGFINTNILRSLIGVVAIVLGIYNLYEYYKERKLDDGCHVVDEKKRKNIISKVKKIKEARNFGLALIGVCALAVSVNMVELACSAGFPTIFNEILVANNVTGIMRIMYLLIYVLFYMIDDLVVFIISMCTLSIAGMTTKYNKLVKIIGGILMLLMGILLIFKPSWIMLNF